MPILNVSINSQEHQIACEAGDEERLLSLTNEFDKRVAELIKVYPNSKETTLYLIASLMILDELEEQKNKQSDNAHITQDLIADIFKSLTHKIEVLTEKVEKL